MAQQIENRQRVIFVSNAKSDYNNGEMSLPELSAQFPNVVFFTDDYCPQLPGYDYRKVNIWKGGQPFIKVHGLASNHSVAINDAMITLTLSEDGFLGLSINSTLMNVIVLGIVPNNCTEKPDNIAGSFIGNNIETINSRSKEQPLCSNINQYSLFLALQPTKRLDANEQSTELTKQIKIINASLIDDKEDATNAFYASYTVNGVEVPYDDLHKAIGIKESEDVSKVLCVNNAFIDKLKKAHTNVFEEFGDTTQGSPFSIVKFPINITKIVRPEDKLYFYPNAFATDTIVTKYLNYNDNNPVSVNRNQMALSNVTVEPFFNYIKIDNWNDDNDYGSSTYKTITFDIAPSICTSTYANGAFRLNDTRYFDLFNEFIHQNGDDYSQYFKIKSNYTRDLTLNEIKNAYNNWSRKLNNNSFVITKTDKAPLSFELTIPANAQTFFAEVYNTSNPTINIYFDTERAENDLLGSDHIYYDVGPITISETSHRVAIVVTKNGYVDEDGYVDKELVDFLNAKLAENSGIYTESFSSFDDLTGNLSTNPNDVGKEIQLSSYYRESGQKGGYTFIAVPKPWLNQAELSEGRSNLIISNAIRYFIDDPNYGQRYAHFALKPSLFQGIKLGLHKDDIEYVLFRVDTPLSGKILLLNKQNTQIYSNNI